MAQQTNYRTLPTSELDLQLMLTDPEWGKAGVPSELQAKLTEKAQKLEQLRDDLQERINTGVITYEEAEEMLKSGVRDKLWGLLSYYTRDMRLANLSKFDGEIIYCQTWLDFAGDCLRAGYIKAFLTSLSRVITVLELSQSKGGFLRRRHGTFTQEQKQETIEPGKKGLFGESKKKI